MDEYTAPRDIILAEDGHVLRPDEPQTGRLIARKGQRVSARTVQRYLTPEVIAALEEPPAEEPPAAEEDASAEEPPAEEPPAEDSPAEEPAAEEPPAAPKRPRKPVAQRPRKPKATSGK